MLPYLAAGAGVAILGGILGARESAKARGATRAEIKRLEDLVASIIPPEYDISPNDPPGEVMRKLKGADLDFSRVSPEQLSTLGYYAPEAAAYVQEQNPTLVQQTQAGATGRQAQLDALRNYRQIAEGRDPAFQAAMQEAGIRGQQDAQSRMDTVLADSQRRGGFNSGMSFQAMLAGNAGSMSNAAAGQRAAAIESANRRMSAIGGAASVGGQIAGQELDQQARNADIINQFNERTSRNYQQYLNNKSTLANQAQLQNIQMRDKASSDYASWMAGEKERLNNLKTQGFNQQIQKANIQAGIGAQNIAAIQAEGMDKANQIQGVTNAVTGAIGAYGQNQHEKEMRAEDRLWMEQAMKRNPNIDFSKWTPYQRGQV